MSIRVYLCGAHSTGKTTLLNDLMPSLMQVQAYTNVARDIFHELGWKRDDWDHEKHPDTFEMLLEMILKRLLEFANNSISAGTDYVCDRGIDSLVYADEYLGEESRRRLQELPFVQEFIGRLRDSLVFVLTPHPECMEDDGIRRSPNIQELNSFTQKMFCLLEELKIPFKVISVLDRQSRQKQVIEEILKIKPQVVNASALPTADGQTKPLIL